MIKPYYLCLIVVTLAILQPALAVEPVDFSPYRNKMPLGLVKEVTGDKSIRLIVRYFDAVIDADIQQVESLSQKDKQSKAKAIDFKAQSFNGLKAKAIAKMNRSRLRVDRDYSHLPMNVVTVKGEAGLHSLVQDSSVAEVYPDIKLKHFLAQSAPLVQATNTVTNTGFSGADTTVVVLDTGVNYTLSAFGNCSNPGQPASCRVKVAQDFATQDNLLDEDGHGTNVSGVVAAIAPGTQLAVFDVFDGLDAFSSVVIAGINWAIANQQTYNISAINMSLGDTTQNPSLCSSSFSNPYVTPISNAYSAGILTVIASGNSAFTSGLALPACTPKAISVGAVYDSNVGGIDWSGLCTDNTTAADKITCFSNSASYLSLLAPGALISAAGITAGGTSQAAPHVAGAVAILRGARPAETLSSTVNRLTSTGALITDTRNGLNFRRLDILAALGSVNDNFADNTLLTGTTSQTITTINAITSTQFSGKETGEPAHAQNAGGKSVWFEWTAPASGHVNMDTHGSSFNTLLAVYTGNNINSLTVVADNDNDGSANGNSGLSFNATANTVYKIAVDGFNGASGNVVLNLTLDSTITSSPSIKVPTLPIHFLITMAILLMAVQISHKKNTLCRDRVIKL